MIVALWENTKGRVKKTEVLEYELRSLQDDSTSIGQIGNDMLTFQNVQIIVKHAVDYVNGIPIA